MFYKFEEKVGKQYRKFFIKEMREIYLVEERANKYLTSNCCFSQFWHSQMPPRLGWTEDVEIFTLHPK